MRQKRARHTAVRGGRCVWALWYGGCLLERGGKVYVEIQMRHYAMQHLGAVFERTHFCGECRKPSFAHA
jgi:hypothetical protein